jgi:hypothetical protein
LVLQGARLLIYMRFSERIGARPSPSSGIEEASDALRTSLWNLLHENILPETSSGHIGGQTKELARGVWHHLHWAVDEIPAQVYYARRALKAQWFACPWPEFFDLLEFSVELTSRTRGRRAECYEWLNRVLEVEGCAYRFISEQLAPLTNPVEMAEVAHGAESVIPGVAAHIREALKLMPPSVDASPRNSIKESISAVEAAFKQLTGEPTATLGDGLKLFEQRYGPLHESLRRGLVQLYAYTNGPEGMRHALIDEATEDPVEQPPFRPDIAA